MQTILEAVSLSIRGFLKSDVADPDNPARCRSAFHIRFECPYTFQRISAAITWEPVRCFRTAETEIYRTCDLLLGIHCKEPLSVHISGETVLVRHEQKTGLMPFIIPLYSSTETVTIRPLDRDSFNCDAARIGMMLDPKTLKWFSTTRPLYVDMGHAHQVGFWHHGLFSYVPFDYFNFRRDEKKDFLKIPPIDHFYDDDAVEEWLSENSFMTNLSPELKRLSRVYHEYIYRDLAVYWLNVYFTS